jgi:hypothetical protein
MSELLYGIVLGVILALIAGIYRSARALRSQVEALRGEIALARIEGVLSRPPDSTGGHGPAPTIRRRRKHLGVVSAISGVTMSVAAWVRSHRGASVSLAATVALAAGGSLVLDRDTRQTDPDAVLPTASVTTSLLPTATSSRSNTPAPTGARLSPSPSPRSAARDVVLRPSSPGVALPGPTRTALPGPTPTPGPPVRPPAPELTVPPAPSSSAPPSVLPGDGPHCLGLELLGTIAAGTCVSL